MDRRMFVGSVAVTAVALRAAEFPIRLGVVTRVRAGETPDSTIARVKKLGFSTCQIGVRPMTMSDVPSLKAALTKHGVEATAVMELGPGRMVWDFNEGPATIGVVPRETACWTLADVLHKLTHLLLLGEAGFSGKRPPEFGLADFLEESAS